MVKPRSKRIAESESDPVPYVNAKITSWTLRLPQPLIDRLDAEVEARNAKGEGRWSRNGLVVWMLEHFPLEDDALSVRNASERNAKK